MLSPLAFSYIFVEIVTVFKKWPSTDRSKNQTPTPPPPPSFLKRQFAITSILVCHYLQCFQIQNELVAQTAISCDDYLLNTSIRIQVQQIF